jgi:menaquinone-9 beta-reductase
VPELWDAIIVGAGPAGSSLASRLGAAGRSVLLLDSARFPRDKLCGEYLGAGCLPLLDQIGALRDVQSNAHPGRVVSLHSPCGLAFTARYPKGLCSLSLPRRQLDAILLDCARKRESIVVREGFRVEKLLLEGDSVRGVTGRPPGGEEETFRARVTVGADGRNSILARSLGLFRWRSSHRRLALGRHYEGIQPAGDGAEICVGRSFYGILNHQKHGSGNVSIVVHSAGLEAWKGRLDAWFDALLSEIPSLRDRLESAQPVESVRALGPLAHYATRVSVDGALLAGDAAGFYDPFTGEGVYMALESARLAAETIHLALENRCWTRCLLSRYDTSRAASLRGRYRLQGVIQRVVGCPRLADFAAKRLQVRERFVSRLLEVIGGLRRPFELLSLDV